METEYHLNETETQTVREEKQVLCYLCFYIGYRLQTSKFIFVINLTNSDTFI